jgi:hypothetical protein
MLTCNVIYETITKTANYKSRSFPNILGRFNIDIDVGKWVEIFSPAV